MGLDWIGYTTTAVTPRASLQSDAKNIQQLSFWVNAISSAFGMVHKL